MTDSVAEQRRQLLARLFPEGVPTLWCPLLTHYTADGAVDTARMAAHLAHLSRWVKGYLIPGTTGDGWELTPEETRTVTAFAVESARERELHLLIGILQREAPAARDEMEKTAAWLQQITGADSALEAMRLARVSGFAVCPPAGEERPQEGIRDALAGLLSLELPLALYQLPQITKNEMSPEVVAALAARFPNLILLKDSSGADRVALAGGDLPHVFLVRGAEGGFARWLRAGGGPYDGFLLSTANCLAPELAEVLRLAQAGKREEAEAISARLSSLIEVMFAVVAEVRGGNAFTNANKAMDHFFAYGSEAVEVAPPRLHSGGTLPVEVIRRTAEELWRHDVMPAQGYLG
jgi:dihydrodipicolinate synthase/N-acetylneuraminate lyase